MIALRLVLAVSLVLIAGCGASEEPVNVTGEFFAPEEEIEGERSGETIPGIGLSIYRDRIYRGAQSGLSDDRVNGEMEHVADMEFIVEGDRTTGYITATRVTIVNEGGTWVGTGDGTTTWTTGDTQHVHSLDYTLLGTGDYEGLRFIYYVEGIDYPWQVTGTIEPVGG